MRLLTIWRSGWRNALCVFARGVASGVLLWRLRLRWSRQYLRIGWLGFRVSTRRLGRGTVATPDRGAVIAPAARMLVIWGPHIYRTDVDASSGLPLSLTVFRSNIAPSTVETIIGNLRFGDPDFPITVVD